MYQHAIPPPSYLTAYVQHLEAAGRARGTIRLRLHHLSQLRAEAGEPLDLALADLEAHMARRREQAAESRKSCRASLRAFYRWAQGAGLRADDPAACLPAVRVLERPARVASDADLRAALARATPRDRAIILLARSACLRRAEIARLAVADRVGDVLRVDGKGGRVRMVWPDAQVLAALDALEPAEGWYFPGRFGGHLHPESVSGIVKRATGWHPHALRHAGASAAYAATHDLRTLQLVLGHASVTTTQRYVTVPAEAQAALTASMHLAA